MSNFWQFFEKISNFGQFFDIQMAILWRVSPWVTCFLCHAVTVEVTLHWVTVFLSHVVPESRGPWVTWKLCHVVCRGHVWWPGGWQHQCGEFISSAPRFDLLSAQSRGVGRLVTWRLERCSHADVTYWPLVNVVTSLYSRSKSRAN